MTLEAVDRISVTTVVDNSVDILRADEKVARRWTSTRARRFSTLRAEHGLAHWVEVAIRGGACAYLVPFSVLLGAAAHAAATEPRGGRPRGRRTG